MKKRLNWRLLLLVIMVVPMAFGFTIVDKNTGQVKELGLKCRGPAQPTQEQPPPPPPEDPHPPKN